LTSWRFSPVPVPKFFDGSGRFKKNFRRFGSRNFFGGSVPRNHWLRPQNYFQIVLRDDIAGRMEEMNELCGGDLMKSMLANVLV
jgi:hypothetical protein